MSEIIQYTPKQPKSVERAPGEHEPSDYADLLRGAGVPETDIARLTSRIKSTTPNQIEEAPNKEASPQEIVIFENRSASCEPLNGLKLSKTVKAYVARATETGADIQETLHQATAATERLGRKKLTMRRLTGVKEKVHAKEVEKWKIEKGNLKPKDSWY